MKLLLTASLAVLTLTSWGQEQEDRLKTRRNSFITAGTISLAASGLCLYGAWIQDLPKFDSSSYRNDPSYYVRKFENDYNSAVQTRSELRIINLITGTACVTLYTMAYITNRKMKKTKLSGMILPNGFYVSYSF